MGSILLHREKLQMSKNTLFETASRWGRLTERLTKVRMRGVIGALLAGFVLASAA
jgi:hypothetical protein